MGTEFVLEKFVGHEVDSNGNLWLLVRWWGYADEKDTWEPWHKFDRGKVVLSCQRHHLPPPLMEEQA